MFDETCVAFFPKCLFLKFERAPQSRRTEFSVKVNGFLAQKYGTRNPKYINSRRKEKDIREL